jgi:thiosulfate reductase/polysulfide reductase chain A
MVFMLHGFGKQVKAQSRSYQKGAADGMLQANLSDKIGGSPAFDQNLVEVRPI